MDISALYAPIQAQQAANNAWSAEQAQKAMDYQTYMSNTAHQREVEDLKKAGLNPVLSAGGQGASTTSGVAASAGNENVTALYGLLNKSLDANMKAAQAMQMSAKYTASRSTDSFEFSTGVPLLDSGLNALADIIYRKTGAKQENTLPILQKAYGIVTGLLSDVGSIFNANSSKSAEQKAVEKELKDLDMTERLYTSDVNRRIYYGENPDEYNVYTMPLVNSIYPLRGAMQKAINKVYAGLADEHGKEAIVDELMKDYKKTKKKKRGV